MTEKRINPLFDDEKPESPVSVLSSEVSEASNKIPLSPIDKKPMKKVYCDGIPAYYDAENRLVLPVKE